MCATVSRMTSHSAHTEQLTDARPPQPPSVNTGEEWEQELYSTLFALARLCIGPFTGSVTGVAGVVDGEWVQSVLAVAVPIWVAEVVSLGDYLSPLLMLLEAASDAGHSATAPAIDTQHCSSLSKSSTTVLKDDDDEDGDDRRRTSESTLRRF